TCLVDATGAHALYSLSLHDALPIWGRRAGSVAWRHRDDGDLFAVVVELARAHGQRPARLAREQVQAQRGLQPALLHRQLEVEHRSEEHTSELQSRENLVCRLRLEKK